MSAKSRRRSRRTLFVLLAFASICGASAGPAPAVVDRADQLKLSRTVPDRVPGEVIVRFASSATASQRSAARSGAGVAFGRSLRVRGAQLVRTRESVSEAVRRLEAQPGVLYAQPNFRYRALAAPPNDPRFGEQWGLENTGQTIEGQAGQAEVDVNALSAWDNNRGAGSVIAIVDTGVDKFHPDVAPNLWQNDDPANGVDDDLNGIVDDTRGYDFVGDDTDPDDFETHGTHVAGTAAAVDGNALGIAGVAPDAQIMPVRVLDGDGSGTTATVGNGIVYAAEEGADVINLSLGHPGSFDPFLENGINVARDRGAVVVTAAGNDDADNDNNDDPYVPCNLTQSNLICVASVDNDGALSSFSNFGATSVDVGAPGGDILSARTDFDNLLPDSSFESGALAPNWTTSGTPTWGIANVGATGTKSATDSPAGNYPPDANGAITGPAVSFTGLKGCRFDFQLRLDMDAPGPPDPGDVFDYYATFPPNGEYPPFSGGLNGTTGGDFIPWKTSLESLDGEASVRPNFQIFSDADAVVDDGAYVDDVLLGCRPASAATEDETYHFLSGTSMAAPHVSGIAALVRQAAPAATAQQIVQAIRNGATPLPSLAGKTCSGGLADAAGAIAAALSPPQQNACATTGGGGSTGGGTTGGGGAVTPPTPPFNPALSVPGRATFPGFPRSIRVTRRGRFTISFSTGAFAQEGTAALRSVARVRTSARRRVTLARRRFGVPATRRVRMRIRLSRRNLRILKLNRRYRVRLNVELRNVFGRSTASRTFTLRAPRP